MDYNMVSTEETALKLGINGTGLVQRASIEDIKQDARQAALDGFDSYWLAEHPSGGFDASLEQPSLNSSSVQRLYLRFRDTQ